MFYKDQVKISTKKRGDKMDVNFGFRVTGNLDKLDMELNIGEHTYHRYPYGNGGLHGINREFFCKSSGFSLPTSFEVRLNNLRSQTQISRMVIRKNYR